MLISLHSQEEKTHRFYLNEAEESFVKNNLMLLASKFQIDTKKAGIIQARLYANPNIFIEQNVFNDRTDRYFDTTRNGQSVIQIQQLFLLGGKIDKRIKVAEINKTISEQQFFDLLRSLKFELRNNFFGLYYLRKQIQFYEQSIKVLSKTVENVERAYQKRAVLKAEVLRLKALLFFLENEKTEALVQARNKEASLKVLMNRSELQDARLEPNVDHKTLDDLNIAQFKLEDVIKEAFENRPDLKLAIQAIKLEEANLELQKANAIPDLAFGPVYNRAGTYIPNYFGFTAQISVPIFDRNQGNIEAAEKAILVRRAELQNQKLQAEYEVRIVYNRLQEKDKIYQEFKNKFTDEYTNLAELMIQNYEKRYLTIIEFADFFETYRSSIQQILKLQLERAEAIENLNYSAGKNIITIQK
jgi:outer membrane protein TolC